MIGNILVGLVALIHVYIVYLEMVLWDTPRGHKTFRLTPEFANASKVLAANQGLYNGFLAAGLIWGFISAPPVFRSRFSSCCAWRLPASTARQRSAERFCSSRPCRRWSP